MMQAMIFAAGLGTRLKPLTDTMPKALVEVGGEPLIKRVILRLKEAGFTRVVVNVHHFADQIVDYLAAQQGFGIDVRISDERSQPAVASSMPHLSSTPLPPFLFTT